MNKDILEKIKQSQEAYSESSTLRSKARSLEYDALCDIFKSRGIIFGKTIVKSKETGRRGILRTTGEVGVSPGLFFNVYFYPITKKGHESSVQSYVDRGAWWHNFSGDTNYSEGRYKGFEAMADCYEIDEENESEGE